MAEHQSSEFQATPGRNVFISYASQDLAVANNIVEALERQGIKCWIAPRDVRPGTVYADAIVGAINESKALVLVLSANAMPSAHVGREVERAASKRKQVIAFRIDATPLSRALEYFLSDSQWIDVVKLGMPAALTTLTAAVRQTPTTPLQTVPVGRTAGVSTRKLAIVATVVGLGLAVAGAVYFWSKTQTSASTAAAARIGSLAKSEPGAATPDKSIAVLPLANESGDPNQQYFSDGLSENLITALTQFPGLMVIGRTSAFQFRDSKEDAHSIGAKLGVARLLEGSVQRSGETVRVRADLIDTADGSTKWSERYDRPYKDLFALQDEITRAVVEALRVRLLPGQYAAAQDERPPSGSLEAYNALLQGRFYEGRNTGADTRRAIDFYTQATQFDARYVLAWCFLSGGWTHLGTQFREDELASKEAFMRAREAAERALALAPDLAAAHIALGDVLSNADLNWRGTEKEFRRAMELAPNDSDTKAVYGSLLAIFGDFEQAIALIRQALAADPLRGGGYYDLANILLGLNRLDEAERAIRRAIELEPSGVGNYWTLATIEVQRGNASAARAAAQQEPAGLQQDIAVAVAQQIGSDRGAADAALGKLIQKHANSVPYSIAEIYALRRDTQATFEWLDRAWISRDSDIGYLLFDPFILRFKDDPRFAAFCRKVGLPTPAEVAGRT